MLICQGKTENNQAGNKHNLFFILEMGVFLTKDDKIIKQRDYLSTFLIDNLSVLLFYIIMQIDITEYIFA